MSSTPESKRQSEKPVWQARQTLDAMKEGVICLDPCGHIDYLNPTALKMLDLQEINPIGEPLSLWVKIIDEQTHKPLSLSRSSLANSVSGNVLLLQRSGLETPINLSVALLSEEKEPTFVLVLRDISRENNERIALSMQASHDALTDLVNRTEFTRRLNRILSRSESQDSPHALLFLDLDQFKPVNDSCGHQAGDELLKQLSTLLLATLRGRDTLARLGGDEFGVLLEHCPANVARQVAEKLRQAVQNFRFVWQDKAFSIGLSIGLVYLENGMTAEIAISKADAACYAAKSAGRNRVYVFRESRQSDINPFEKNVWIDVVRNALSNTEKFQLQAQAIINISSGIKQISAYEILLRLEHKNQQLQPDSFFSAASRGNMLHDIDRLVIRDIVEQIATTKNQTHLSPNSIFINISDVSLSDKDFPQFVLEQLALIENTASILCFEIREVTIVNQLSDVTRFMKSLKNTNCQFAIDKMGSAQCALYSLQNLHFDYLKIDSRLLNDEDFGVVVANAIISVANKLNIIPIASHIEDQMTLQKAINAGITYAQGYYLARPVDLQMSA